jgi:general secretion pathway protein K
MSALWLVVALSTLALELSVIARHRRLVVANTLESVRAERAATSGVEHERARLALLIRARERSPRADAALIVDPWRQADSTTRDTVTMDDGASYAVVSADVGTMVNINLVDEAGLARFLIASSIDPNAAEALSQVILDWRDADDFRRPRGAERDDYIKSGVRELPGNGPFESVDELRFVRGVTPSIFEKIARRLTVFGVGEINVNKASEAVLLSIPGMTSLAAAVITGVRRRSQRIETLRQLLDILPPSTRTAFEQNPMGIARLAFETNEIEARSVGWVRGSPIRVIETAIITRVGISPVVTWRRTE